MNSPSIVTMTGADDSVDPKQLVEISSFCPSVEWGILVSKSSMGSPRFPSLGWMKSFYDLVNEADHKVRISLHICGSWVRDICTGNWTPLFTNIGPFLSCVQRVQLNFHSYEHLISNNFVREAKARASIYPWRIIFQCDGVNDHLVSNTYNDGLNVSPLYDRSGGAGVVPALWPKAMKGFYCGYAGGLGFDNMKEQLPRIQEAANGQKYWIDMETKIRTPDNKFDVRTAAFCLETALGFE